VIHSFCERYSEGDDLDECLKASFEEVVRLREAELADRILEIDVGTALRELRPLAENYRSSAVRRRIESVRAAAAGEGPDRIVPSGVFSERRFRLRRPRAIVTGTIDKLLIYSDPSGEGLSAEIIDFKTNRFRSPSPNTTSASRTSGSAKSTLEQSSLDYGQLSFNFEGERAPTHTASQQTEIEAAARDYELQMQAYALAAHELMPQVSSVRVTLHFVDPNVEVSLPDERLTREACSNAVDRATEELIRSTMPEDFPVSPTHHCRSCGFLEICRPGRTWLSRQA
jgi:ATP-dependent exoDNAse (exonuclease V) beta subunit